MSRAFEGKGNDRKLKRRQLKFSPSNYLLMSLESNDTQKGGCFYNRKRCYSNCIILEMK